MSRHQYHRHSQCLASVKLLGKVKSAFATKVHVYQRNVRPQILDAPQCVGDVRRSANDLDPPRFKQAGGRLNEMWVVVDN